jgi:CRISPR-associated protein Cas1
MPRSYYIFSNGRLKRKENTVFFESSDKKVPVPVENIDQIYIFGEVDFNTKFIDLCAKYGIVLHFFNYYGFYSGSYYPREELISGDLIIRQVEYFLDPVKRIFIARKIVEGAVHNLRRNLEKRGFYEYIERIKNYERNISNVGSISELMAIEAHVRKEYYKAFEEITGWEFRQREIRPPSNPLNALISFGNSLVYTSVLKEIYMTPLNPAVSYLHQPSERRYSLSLDISEIFKPVLSDRLIMNLINNNIIKLEHFERALNFSYLNNEGRKIFIKKFDEKLESTVLHRKLRRKVKYRTLIRLELYKLIKYLYGEKNYSPLKVWW